MPMREPDNTVAIVKCPLCGGQSLRTAQRLGGFELFLCNACNYRFAYDAFNVKVDYNQLYESMDYLAEQVNPIEQDFEAENFALHPTYRPFFVQVACWPGATLLDFGCGVGRFCHAAASVGWSVSGIDTSEQAISVGRRKAAFPLRYGTLDDELSRGATYDALTAFEVMEHVPDPVGTLKKMARLLRPGGHIFVTVPNWDSPEIRNAVRPDLIPPVHVGFHQKRSVKVMLEASGFRNVVLGEIGGFERKPGLRGLLSFIVRKCRGKILPPIGVWGHARK